MNDSPLTIGLSDLQALFDSQELGGSGDDHSGDDQSSQSRVGPSERPWSLTLTGLDGSGVRAEVDFNAPHLRPGGLVAGPVLFGVVDAMGWLATVSRSEPGGEAVTIDVAIRFLAPVPSGVLFAEAVVLRAGRRSVVSSVSIATAAEPDRTRVHAVVSFAPVVGGLAGVRGLAAAHEGGRETARATQDATPSVRDSRSSPDDRPSKSLPPSL